MLSVTSKLENWSVFENSTERLQGIVYSTQRTQKLEKLPHPQGAENDLWDIEHLY
jgi:hypothetical protein